MSIETKSKEQTCRAGNRRGPPGFRNFCGLTIQPGVSSTAPYGQLALKYAPSASWREMGHVCGRFQAPPERTAKQADRISLGTKHGYCSLQSGRPETSMRTGGLFFCSTLGHSTVSQEYYCLLIRRGPLCKRPLQLAGSTARFRS